LRVIVTALVGELAQHLQRALARIVVPGLAGLGAGTHHILQWSSWLWWRRPPSHQPTHKPTSPAINATLTSIANLRVSCAEAVGGEV